MVGSVHYNSGVMNVPLAHTFGEQFLFISRMNLAFQVCSMIGLVQVSKHWQELLLFATGPSSRLVKTVFQF